MSRRRSIAALETLILCTAVLAVSCATGADLGRPPLDDGQAPLGGSGGVSGAGGSVAAGGAGVSGGTAGALGSTGGSSGSVGVGGASGAGGGGGTGGANASGGSGGTSSGGATSSGGTVSSGGAASSGGATSSGGAVSSGGVTGAGGSCGSSGSPGTGGASVDAGAPNDFCSLSQSAFCDDFADGNACGWTTSGGSWSVSSDGGFVYSGASGSYNSTVGMASWTDQTVEAKMKILRFGGSGSSYRAGIIARYGQSTNYYTLAIDAAGNVVLMRGTSSPSGSSGTCAAIPSGLSSVTNAWVDLKIQVSGAAGNVHILTWVNGTQVHDCTTTNSTLAMGAAGVMTYGSNTQAEFDDFRVSTP